MRIVLSCGLLKWFYAFASQQHQAKPASHAFNSEKLKFKKIQKFWLHLIKHLMHLPSKLKFKKVFDSGCVLVDVYIQFVEVVLM